MNLQSLLKLAAEYLHAHERGEERLQLPRESVDEIQRLADKMWYGYGRKKLFGVKYYTPLRDKSQNILGYAAFQRVGQPYKGRLILTTILGREMKPRGDNIGGFLQGIVPKRPNDLKPYKGFDPIPNARKG